MAKDDAADENDRLRNFRKLFNDYTNNNLKKPSGRRSVSNNSPSTESPISALQRRSGSRAPRNRARKKSQTGEVSPASPSSSASTISSASTASPSAGTSPAATPEKDAAVAEAKDLAKADDEEFENDDADTLAKCKIKTRDLQWKAGGVTEEDKKKKAAEAERNRSMDEAAENGIRRRKSRVTPKKPSRRKKTTGSISSPVSVSPSAETIDDTLPVQEKVEKGVRCRAKRTNGPDVLRSKSPSAEPCNEEPNDLQEIDQNSKEFKQAIKLMEILKRNNLLENALFPAQNEVVKAFFEGGMRNPDNKILGLISKAMDFVLDAVFFRGEDLDCMLDSDLKSFIVDRSKSKPILLDVIISRPEFLPQSWGGRTVVLRGQQHAAETNVHVEGKKDEKK